MEKRVFRIQWDREAGQMNIEGEWTAVTKLQIRHKRGAFVNFTEADVSHVGDATLDATLFAFFLDGRTDEIGRAHV